MENYQPYDEFKSSYEKQRKSIKRPTILVAGYTGTGKTSLIQAICGKNVVPDDRIGAGLPVTKCFNFYENENIRFFDSKGLEPGKDEKEFVDDVNGFVRKLQEDQNVDNHVHLVWYAIQGPGARVTPCDLRLMKEIFPRNQIVAITKNDITKPIQREEMSRVLVENGTRENHIVLCSEDDHQSLLKLEKLSHDLLPEAYRDAWDAVQAINIDKKKTKATIIIHSASASAAGAAGLNPLPLSDAALITPIQMSMIAGLAIVYGETEGGLKAAILPLIAESVGIQTAASLAKLFPGLGNVFNAGVAAALTEAVGQTADIYLLSRCVARMKGEPVPDLSFDPSELYRIFKKHLKLG